MTHRTRLSTAAPRTRLGGSDMPLPQTSASWRRIQELEGEAKTIGELDDGSPVVQLLDKEWKAFIAMCEEEREAARIAFNGR